MPEKVLASDRRECRLDSAVDETGGCHDLLRISTANDLESGFSVHVLRRG